MAYALQASADTETDKATATPVVVEPNVPALPDKLVCQAVQTAGLHDYDGPPESYEPAEFFESRFALEINRVLTRHLANSGGTAEATPDLYLTLTPRNKPASEFRCRQVRGAHGAKGFSCSNTPPSDMLLLNPATLRFTRSSIAGWTFSDQPPDQAPNQEQNPAHMGDDSLFVEFGTCEAR